jgi:hypothetical protein
VAERTRSLKRLHVLLLLLRDLLSDPVGKQLCAEAAARLLGRARPRHPAGRVRTGGWPPSWCERCVHWSGGLPSSTSASRWRWRWRLRAPPSPRSSAWDRSSWRPRSSASWAIMWGGSRAQGALLRLLGGPRPDRGLQRGGAQAPALARREATPQQGHAHEIALCQAPSDPRGGAYHRKKLAEGKWRREAMRCLKRRVSDAVFGALVADWARASLAPT